MSEAVGQFRFALVNDGIDKLLFATNGSNSKYNKIQLKMS